MDIFDKYKTIQGVKHKTPDPENWKFANTSVCKKVYSYFMPSDYSIKSKFPEVYDQGQHGSCTSNAVLACDDYYYHGVGKKWIPSTIFTYYNQKVLVDKEKQPLKDNGSSVESAIKAVKRYGACSAKVWSNEEPFDLQPSDEAYQNGLKGHEITKYYKIQTLLQLKKALYANYPVVGAVDWAFRYYDDNYVMNTPTKKEIKESNGHAIVFVGYDDSRQVVEFRNSWSNQWANNGYAYMTYDVLKKVMWWDDTYAIVR